MKLPTMPYLTNPDEPHAHGEPAEHGACPPASDPTPLWLETWERVSRRFFHDAAQPVSYILAGAQRLQQSQSTVDDWPHRDDVGVRELREDYGEVVDDVAYGAQQLTEFVAAARTIQPGGERPGDLARAISAAVKLCQSVAKHAGTAITWTAPHPWPAVSLSTDLCANVVTAALLQVCNALSDEGAGEVGVVGEIIGQSICIEIRGVPASMVTPPEERAHLDRALFALREGGGRFSTAGDVQDRRWVLHFPVPFQGSPEPGQGDMS